MKKQISSNWKTTLAFLIYHYLLVYSVIYKAEVTVIVILTILCAYVWTLLKSSNELFTEVVRNISEGIKDKWKS